MSLPLSQFADQLAEHLSEVLADTSLLERMRRSCDWAKKRHESRLFTITLHFDRLDPLAVLERLAEVGEMRFYWEKPELELAMAGSGSLEEVLGSGPQRFAQVSEGIRDAFARHDGFSVLTHSLTGLHFMGGFSFFDAETNGDWQGFGTGRFVAPEWQFVRDGNLGLLTLAQKVEPGIEAEALNARFRDKLGFLMDRLSVYRKPFPNPTASESPLEFDLSEGDDSRLRWNNMVRTATRNIRNGHYEKIVLARNVVATTSRPVTETRLLHHLRREYPACYSFLLQFPDTACFVGSTPERLLSVQSGFLTTEGLAGSIPRGMSATDDSILEKRLLLSDKDQEEHRFVVDSIVQRLQQFSSEVKFSPRPGIRKFANVQHLFTPISARLPFDTDPLDVLAQLHPTPAVGGVPRQSALEGIPELEGFRRGWYAGPVGWVNGNGRGEFSVAIRSGLIDGTKATFYAGCGIVEGSDPDNEWDETELKLIPMVTALRHA